MHYIHAFLSSIALLLLSNTVNATTLNVYYLNGNPHQLYSTDTVKSITLPSNARLIINKSNGTSAVDDSTSHIRSIVLGESSNIRKINNDENRYLVYPNPVAETLSINNLEKDTHIYLFSVSGKLLVDKLVSDRQYILNVSNLESGSYLLKINNESYKIIKSK